MVSNSAQDAQAAQSPHDDRRRSRRSEAPLIQIRCEGECYVPANWSLGGCLITGYEGPLRSGASVDVELLLNVDHAHEGLPLGAEVLRYESENKALALRFYHLDAADIWDFCSSVDAALADELACELD